MTGGPAGRPRRRRVQRSGRELVEPGQQTGCPLIVELPCWFEARVTDTVPRGDHTVFVAEVVEAGVRDDPVTPLLLRDTGTSYGG